MEEHGSAIDAEGRKLRCNYCGKVVTGSSRLKHHLGAVGTDVAACTQVPEAVRLRMRCLLLEHKKDRLLKEICNGSRSYDLPPPQIALQIKEAMEAIASGSNGHSSHCCMNISCPAPRTVLCSGSRSVSRAQELIGRFLFDAGLGPEVVQMPSFRAMVGAPIVIPSPGDLKGTILHHQLEEMRRRANGIKQHWPRSGCSVILETWRGRGGRSLMCVLVHCARGVLFLRSLDISDVADDVDEVACVLRQVVEEVGVHNVVQVITDDASPYMQAAQHAVAKQQGGFFFTLCADHCVDLLLGDIAALEHVNRVLMKAKQITRFIHSHAVPAALKHKYIRGREILSSSTLKHVAQFITLENLVSEESNLVRLFGSPDWLGSSHVANMVSTDTAFWHAAADIVKVTSPLVGVLYNLEADGCPMGILYDAMDRAKEEIEKNLPHQYDDFWVMIDRVWDNYLHSPIHCAGYFLNPRLFYSPRFSLDAEVAGGIAACMIRLAGDHHDRETMVAQIEAYRTRFGVLDSDAASEETMTMPQVDWWSVRGAATPELQQLAVRILSQTCSGASRYKFDRTLSEQLHAVEGSCGLEQERLRDMEYALHNLALAQSLPLSGAASWGQHGKPTQLGDWI